MVVHTNDSHIRPIKVFQQDPAIESGEEEIPTIVLKHEFAVHPLDMLVEVDGDTSVNNSCKDNIVTCECITVDDADYNEMSQTVLYGQDEHRNFKETRAAYISATVHKASEDTALGMGIKQVNGVLTVSSLKSGCLLSETPIRTGDIIISVNNISCIAKSPSKVAAILKSTVGLLTIVVENPTGDPTLAESSVMKPTPESKVGLGVVPTSSHRVKVSSINPTGIFANSLISRQDRVISVNGTYCKYLDATEAAKIITSSNKTVTVVVEKKFDSAAVVALDLKPIRKRR